MKHVSLMTLAIGLPLAHMAFSPSSVLADVPASRPAASPAPATDFFDPARHMRVAEIRPGMTGYGLTVFHGSHIEPFHVEVISILRNFSVQNDVVLIRCTDEFLKHTGSIAGMSGSPIFLRDTAGKDRMIGAFAYGWPMAKDAVAGVQPIEYMLKLPTIPAKVSDPAAQPNDSAETIPVGTRTIWSLKDAGLLPVAWQGDRAIARRGNPSARSSIGELTGKEPMGRDLTGNADMPRLEPLATPLMTSGMSSRLIEQLAPRFRAAGLMPLEAGVGGSGVGDGDDALKPGSVLAVPMLTGDMEMTAVGTVTEKLGDSVWGFGHPFNNEGPIALPMGSGVINGVIANLNTSFKLGSLTQLRGTLTTDASVGVAGRLGGQPPAVPIELTVQPADGSTSRAYHFQVSQHSKFTPILAAAAFAAGISGKSELPQYNTVDYDIQLAFNNDQTVRLINRSVNVTSGDLFGDAGVVMQAAADNPFHRVTIRKITANVTVRPDADSAQIVDVNVPRNKYRPGEKVVAFVTHQPFRGPRVVVQVDVDLPRDLSPGAYQLVISDAPRYIADEQQSKPFRFTAESIGDVFSVLKEVTGIRQNAIYIRLLRRPDGVAIGHVALANLPSSRREILLESGRSNTTAFTSSIVKIVPTDPVMSGSAEFTINVETSTKVAVSALRAPKVEPPAVKPEEPKKPPGSTETPGKIENP